MHGLAMEITMEKKLSKTQVDVLILLCEGTITQDLGDYTLSLEDGDNNLYSIRNHTFNILNDGGYIMQKSRPSLDVYTYGLSPKAEEYLTKYHYEEIKDFIS